MNLITFIFGIIILIFAILQIVLFFKLWRMTNDVHLIKENKQISSNDQEEILWLLGKHGKIDPVGTDEIDPVKTA